MYQPDAEMLFPSRVIPQLRNLRGATWSELVDQVAGQDETHPDSLAFGLMMIRLDGCLRCHADSYRAMRGCTACSRQSLLRYKGSDADLLCLFVSARSDVVNYLTNRNRLAD